MAGLPISERRLKRFKEVIAHRQLDLTVVLENVHDPHNIGAVLRTCDAVGVGEVFVILDDPKMDIENYQIGTRSSSSAKKWIDVHIFQNFDKAIETVRKDYHKILGTHLSAESKSLYEMDFTSSVALMFGNEHDGLSTKALEIIDGNFIIPQYGMTQSLNISVACAISLYEACRQRTLKGKYDNHFIDTKQQVDLLSKFSKIHEEGYLKKR